MNKVIRSVLRAVAFAANHLGAFSIRSQCRCEIHRELANALAKQQERKLTLVKSSTERT